MAKRARTDGRDSGVSPGVPEAAFFVPWPFGQQESGWIRFRVEVAQMLGVC